MANRVLTIRALCVGAMAFAAVAQAGAMVFSFSYSDLAGDVAVGMINATQLSGNVYLATSGTFTVSYPGGPAGVYSLVANPNADGSIFTSPSTAFVCDDVLYNGSDPVLDAYGLLLAPQANVNALGQENPADEEINIWGNSPGNYSNYHWTSAGSYDFSYVGAATVTLTAVPEPVTIGLACAAFLLGAWRRRRS